MFVGLVFAYLWYGVNGVFWLKNGDDVKTTVLRMPGVKPSQPDAYMCHGVQMSTDHDEYIVKFEPHGTMNTAHHMLFYSCGQPGTDKPAWNCGGMGDGDNSDSGPICQGDQRIIYAWARNAKGIQMPEGVGFRVGGKTGMNYIVVQIHYMHKMKHPDYSGATIYTVKTPMPKLAAVTVMATGGTIKSHSKLKMDIACPVTGGVEMHPFAYRTHTHKLGRVVSGYVVRNGHWHLIGKRNPQDPQMFYPVLNKQLTIRKNDILAARCTMENTFDHDVETGGTGHDEMCNFYIMYWVNATEADKDEGGCGGGGGGDDYQWGKEGILKNIPDVEASSLP